MILTIPQLKTLFQISQSLITQCRRIIKDHPERYGVYGVIGTYTHAGAFLDAYIYRTQLMRGEKVPEYDEAQAIKRVEELAKAQER